MNEPSPIVPSLSADVYWPMMKSASLIAAGELGVFTALNQGPLLAADLARRLQASLDGTERLCALLVQSGYLVRGADDRLGNSAHAQEWLAQTGGSDLSSGLRWFAHAWRLMSDLSAAVVSGAPKNVLWDLMREHPGMGPSFAAYMKDHAAGVVEDIQRAVDLPAGTRTLLDVGGSHGLHATAFCRRMPELSAVIYDLPVSLANTRELLSTWGVGDRIRCVEGNIVEDTIEGMFDAITYFLVAHNQSDADNARVVEKMARALNPGGMLVIYEYVRNPAARFSVSAAEADASAFDLTLLVETGTRTHTAERIIAWLHDAGLGDVVRTNLHPVEKGSVFCARQRR